MRTPSNFGMVGDRPAIAGGAGVSGGAAGGAELFGERRSFARSCFRTRTSDLRRTNLANEKIDAENRYLWRQNRRRLQAEPLLDAMLAVSGELDRTIGGESKPLTAEFRRRSRVRKDEPVPAGRDAVAVRSARCVGDLRAASGDQCSAAEAVLSELGDCCVSAPTPSAKRIEREIEDDGIATAYRICVSPRAERAGRKARP